MTEKDTQTDAVRARIILSAAALLQSEGIRQTSISDVALEADVLRADVLRHFPSKEDLVCAVLESSLDAVARKLQALIDPEGGRAALEPFVREYLSLDHVRHPDRGCPIATMGIEAAQGPERFRDAIHRGRERVIRQLAKGFDLPAEAARRKASTLLAALVGAVIMARSAPTDDDREAILTDTLETLLHSLWSGERDGARAVT